MIHRMPNLGSDTMPVKSEDWCLDDIDIRTAAFAESHQYFQLEPTLSIGVTAEFYTSTVPSDDIWKKFDLPELPSSWSSGSMTEDDYELDAILDEYATATITSPMWAALDRSVTGKEIRHHDCMWAGHCVNKEHNRTLKQLQSQQHTVSKVNIAQKDKSEVSSVTPRVAVCNNSRPSGNVVASSSSTCQNVVLNTPKNEVCVVKTSGRSLLLSSRTASAAKVVVSPPRLSVPATFHRPSLESDGDSPRPETPQSLSESEEDTDDHPRFKHSLDLVVSSSVAGASGSSGFTVSNQYDCLKERSVGNDYQTCKDFEDDEDAGSSISVSISEVTGQVCRPVDNSSNTDSKIQPSEAYYNDHSYHSKSNVRMDNLGVQTPSDSEEEIDVVSLGEKAPPSRSGATLPTNPTPRDRQQLQLTVASAMSASTSRKRTAGNSGSKVTKRARHQYHHRLAHHKTGRRAPVTSDSEPDSCEKRSMHNNMERQRRVDLRNLVEGLRVLVPAVEPKPRAAKVVILREGASYCRRLTSNQIQLKNSVRELQMEQQRLRNKLSLLRKVLAAKR